jgi:putative radical SAM enzyme (TIGR03279 family)
MPEINGIKILEVVSGSATDRIGIEPGDRLLTVNGHEITDELALRFYLNTEERAVLRWRRPGGAIRRGRINIDEAFNPGVIVEEFPTRRCSNKCIFCFVDQLPPEARPALRVKDDDYRLSFLYGNYVTLTNVTEKDIDRIIEQRLSPLYVSVHATDPELRARVLGRKKADNLEKKLSRLVRGGVRIHAQIVLMPGINDGDQLEKTVMDLYRFHPGVESVAIVPVGISAYAPRGNGLRPATGTFSRALIRRADKWRQSFISRSQSAFVFPADEFYLLAGEAIPERDHYEDFAQIEDGVGMVRLFIDDFNAAMARRRKSLQSLRGTLVTGRLFFPVLEQCIAELNRRTGAKLTVCAAENRFLGKRVTVAGLLSGKDILSALRGRDAGGFVIIPGEALAFDNRLLLDGLTLTDLSLELDRPVYSGGRSAREFFKILGSRLTAAVASG